MASSTSELANKAKNLSGTDNGRFHYSKQQLLELYHANQILPEHMIELPVVVKDVLKPWANLSQQAQDEVFIKKF